MFFNPNEFPPLFSAALGTDGYKFDHHRQYPDKTEIVVSNFTPRSSRRGATHVALFGVQFTCIRYLIQHWNVTFFNRPKEEVVEEFVAHVNAYLGPENRVGHKHMEALHDLGYLPVRILALPEGTVYPLKVPGFVIHNTKPEFYWVTNFLETILSTTIWGMCTSATTAKIFHDLLEGYALKTVGDASFVPYQGHDFSFRGMQGSDAAATSGLGHLTSFVGTDTHPSIQVACAYYKATLKENIGKSVGATEHAVMCAGKKEGEIETFRRLIEDLYQTGIVSIVSDTWDFWYVLDPVNGILRILKDKIMARPGKVVIRPDTGDPVRIVCGDAYPIKIVTPESMRRALDMGYTKVRVGDNYFTIVVGRADGLSLTRIMPEDVTLEMKGAIQCLWDIFGGTMTPTGYKMLDSHIGLIYGDSITIERADNICHQLMVMGYASINVVFGIGSYTYAYVTRDTDGYAVKATFVRVDGEDREIFKAPKTGDGTKNSAKGLPAVFKNAAGEFYLKDQATWEELNDCELKEVFCDSKLTAETTFEEVRARLKAY